MINSAKDKGNFNMKENKKNNIFVKAGVVTYFSIRSANTKEDIYNKASTQLKLRLEPYLGEETEWRIFDCALMSIYNDKTGGRLTKITNFPKYVVEIARQQTTETVDLEFYEK